MLRKKLKLSKDRISSTLSKQQSRPTNCNNEPETLLCILPAEILELIFGYLSPRDLMTIQKLGIRRLTEICLVFKTADFSMCSTICSEDVSSLFSSDRVEYIRYINLNNVFFVQANVLEKCIIKCKHLTKLSVYDCGLVYMNILSILEYCNKLEELYWSVLKKGSVSRFYGNITMHKIKKLYLTTKGFFPDGIEIICDLVGRSLCNVEACLNFSPHFTMSLPPSVNQITFAGKLTCITNCSVIVVSSDFRCCDFAAKAVKQEFLTVSNSKVRSILNSYLNVEDRDAANDKNYSFSVNYDSFYLQFLTTKEDLAAIPSLPDCTVRSLVVIMNDSKEKLRNHLERLKRMTGKCLRNLIICSTYGNSSLRYDIEVTDPSDGEFLCDIVTQITSTCLNIQFLNLSDLHFDVPFTLQALYCLKELKTLRLSSCALKSPTLTASEPLIGSFEGIVSNCKKVERFSYNGCIHCQFGLTDDAMLCISKWEKLSHLTISKVVSFRTCHFLVSVADSCPFLKNLELSTIGDLSVCHYISNVIQILRKSKQLTYLRIDQKAFYPMNTLFWKSVELAKNLQGLCLTSGVNTVIENRMITNAIRKLPFLHLFHLRGRRICLNLPAQVRQIMSKNGIQTQNVEINALSSAEIYPLECKYPHLTLL